MKTFVHEDRTREMQACRSVDNEAVLSEDFSGIGIDCTLPLSQPCCWTPRAGRKRINPPGYACHAEKIGSWIMPFCLPDSILFL
jgi:hypothetical protein